MTVKHEENTNGDDMRSLTQQDAAVLVGKPTIWLRDNAHVSCRNEDGSYDGLALVAGLMERLPVEDLGDSELSRKQREAELDRTEAQAEKIRFELEVEQGGMVDINEVVSAISTITSLFSERLVGIADKIAPSLSEKAAAHVVPTIKSIMAETLTGLANEMEHVEISAEGVK